MESRWNIPINEWDKADIKSLIFIFNQAENYFNSLNQVSSNITTRSYTFLAILVSFISIFVSLMYDSSNSFSSLLFYHYFWVLLLIVAFGILVFNVFPHNMMHSGYNPKDIDYNSFFNSKIKKLSHRALVLDQIEDVKQKIDYLDQSNRKRLKCLIAAIILISIAIFYLFIILLI